MQDIFLKANDAAYRRLVRRVARMDPKNPEAILRAVARTAFSASEFHSGRFADGAIENIALGIGAVLADLDVEESRAVPAVAPAVDRRRVLHVATQVAAIGGHTRTLRHWATEDTSAIHSLVVTTQGDEAIPSWLIAAFQESGGEVVSLRSTLSLCDKARWLRCMAKRSASLVVLHHDPYDVVPTVAFAPADCPPVAVVNIADHHFWLGSSIAEIVICIRSIASKHSLERRSMSSSIILPIPLEDPAIGPGPVEARTALGIPLDQVVLLTVGRALKYRPCGPYDFIATAAKILERHPAAHIYVVGESLAGIVPYARVPIHDRLHFVGPIEDPSLYRAAADVYLESFPFGSTTAFLEAALSGLPVVPACGPLVPMLVANDDSLCDVITNPPTEEEYIARVTYLIQHPEERTSLAHQTRTRLKENNTGDGWLSYLAAVYKITDTLTHRPKPIPTAGCVASPWDINLSLWHARADGENMTSEVRGNGRREMLRHASFVAKMTGSYAGALRFACVALGADPLARSSWRVLALRALGSRGLAFVGRIKQWRRRSRVRLEVRPMIDRNPEIGREVGSRNTTGTPRILVMACDEGYAMPLATAIRSAAESNRSGVPIALYVLYHSFPMSEQQKVAESIPEGSSLTIHWIPVDLAAFEGCSSFLGYSKITYSRLSIPDLFPHDVSRVLYIDSDVLVLGDLGPLWDTDLEGLPLGAVLDGLDPAIKAGNAKSENLPVVANYFNSGVLLIDLERWRKEKVSERAIEYLEKHQDTRFADQCALNVVCDGQWKPLDVRWNYQGHFNTLISKVPPEERPAIVHFVGAVKPWDPRVWSINEKFYDAYRGQTKFSRGVASVVRDSAIKYWEAGKRFLKRFTLVRELHALLSRETRESRVRA